MSVQLFFEFCRDDYVCHELTDEKLEYSKTRDGPIIVEHLLRFEPDGLIELKELLRTVLFGGQSG